MARVYQTYFFSNQDSLWYSDDFGSRNSVFQKQNNSGNVLPLSIVERVSFEIFIRFFSPPPFARTALLEVKEIVGCVLPCDWVETRRHRSLLAIKTMFPSLQFSPGFPPDVACLKTTAVFASEGRCG